MDDLILDSPETRFEPVYAGFWERFVASFIDGLITSAITYVPMLAVTAIGLGNELITGMLSLVGAIAGIIYFPLMTSSEKQATFGKQALGLKVTDMQEQRITFIHALGRYFGKIISAIILLIGYIMAAFTEKNFECP